MLHPGCRPYLVAEIGMNHNGDLDLACRTIDAASNAGANAVKFQTFHTDEFMADRSIEYEYDSGYGKKTESMYEMFRRLELPHGWHKTLRDHARQRGVEFLSSNADRASVDLLVSLGVPALKVASEDLINLPLLRYVAAQGKPVILSTGMAEQEEIDDAIDLLRGGGCGDLLLLHCVSLYPAPDESMNLNMIATLGDVYNVPVGFSDHSKGIEAGIAATALGAVLIEKHFTLDRALDGPDHQLSSDPAEFMRLCRAVARVSAQLGRGDFVRSPDEVGVRDVFRRSIVAAVDIPAGAVLTDDMLQLKRPGTGLHPRTKHELVGRRAKHDIRAESQLTLGDVQ